MATFRNLYHASDVLRRLLAAKASIPYGQVIAGAPHESPPAAEEVRVTLAWQQEQSSHRNDGYQRNADGTATPPPVTLSLFYLVTTYGENASNTDTAHRLLGDVLRGVHATPVLRLPDDIPEMVPVMNHPEGEVALTPVPLTPEVMEKLFSLFQVKHRPFMLCEMGPVQLVSPLPAASPVRLVAPGGVVLAGPTPRSRPALERAVPSTLAAGSRLRLDGRFDALVTDVFVGGARFTGTAITVVEAGRSVAVQLPTSGVNAVPPGAHAVSVACGTLASDEEQVQVLPAGSWSLDAPPSLSLSHGVPVTFYGQNLASADALFVWPDGGIRAPGDVRSAPVTAATATSVTAAVPVLPLGVYRLAARVFPPSSSVAQYTPYVVMEVRT